MYLSGILNVAISNTIMSDTTTEFYNVAMLLHAMYAYR